MVNYELEKTANFLKQYSRMCEAQEDCVTCCPVYRGASGNSCAAALSEDPERTIQIVEEWAKDHPEQPENTIYDAVKEKFPGVIIGIDGTPNVCIKMLGYKNIDCATMSCAECWQMPYDSPQLSDNESAEDSMLNLKNAVGDILREVFEK